MLSQTIALPLALDGDGRTNGEARSLKPCRKGIMVSTIPATFLQALRDNCLQIWHDFSTDVL
ncbi:hypothetical protein H6F76_20295 [Leptolyngbya sp. FACHB-321]|uniref:hypothetical protein n=1 Tax=Leptolyngbya sp. FACHB-321 TaxID=2692807 RepID=UPI0016863205|nr:hypothetical protein [Leptolyngbya sp. FACHB-321]MBD2037308.1 hypothetical protein [Leptolyngbya sp. FACHB-321]